ncbi:MAG: tRNA uridine-5-carboxymethylaminomethyl(34) synthesis GTPase MnmE, partial [Acidobacteriaceae bacterium]
EHAGMDAAESLGIARSKEALADADLVLLVHDATAAWTEAEQEVAAGLAEAGSERPHVVVWNKVDLLGAGVGVPVGVVGTSALTGVGMEELRGAILERLGAAGAIAESGVLNTLRQQEAVTETLAALRDAAGANDAGLPHEMILMDLHRGLRALDSLTGATTPDDILARIFAAFCIGK